MGVDILYEGAFVLDKPLQPVQRWYLQHFSDNRRVTWFEGKVERVDDPLRVAVGLPVGPDGAYFVGKEEVGKNYGILIDNNDPLIKEYGKPPHGQPGGRCDWRPSEDGQRIVHNDSEKSFHAKEWLYYLIEHFLHPWGYSLSGQVKWKLVAESEQRGTITIENNGIQDFDVAQCERRVATLQREYTSRPRGQKEEIVYEGTFVFDTPLQPAHRRYLQRFHSNRCVKWFEEQVEYLPDPLRMAVGLPIGPDGAYFVGKEAVGRASDSLLHGTDWLIKAYDIPPQGQPGLWCDWRPSEDGYHLVHDGIETTLANYEWLYYLIEHFLHPWGYSLSGQVRWEVVGSEPERRGTITIKNNAIEGFDVDEYERYLALIQRGISYQPSQQTMSKQERLDMERNLLDDLTKEHPF